MLIPLPRKPSATTLFESFLNAKQRPEGLQTIYREIADGLRQYFDRVLGTLLLYRFERPQYNTILSDHKYTNVSDCYGAEHLLRLFVQFPSIAQQCFWKRQELVAIRQFTSEFLKWLEGNKRVFTNKYMETDDDYWAQFNDVTLDEATVA